jgi:hypothetical protein
MSKSLALFPPAEDEARGSLGQLNRLEESYYVECDGNASLTNQERSYYDTRDGYLKARASNRALVLFILL